MKASRQAGRQRSGLMLCCSWCLFSFVVLETSEKSNLNVPGWSQLCSGELRERSSARAWDNQC